MNNVNLKRLT